VICPDVSNLLRITWVMSKEHLFCEFETSQQVNLRQGWKTGISALYCRLGSAFSLDLFNMNMCKIYNPFMQGCPIQHTLIHTWMILDVDFRAHSSEVTGETPILGYGRWWDWILTVMPHPHSLMLSCCTNMSMWSEHWLRSYSTCLCHQRYNSESL